MSENIYTAFYFKPTKKLEVDNLHMTHKFMGALADTEVDLVKVKLDDFFKYRGTPVLPPFIFDRVDTFELSVVLLGRNLSRVCRLLRIYLDGFAKDQYVYNPHITIIGAGKRLGYPVELPLELQPNAYKLMRGREELYSWKVGTRR